MDDLHGIPEDHDLPKLGNEELLRTFTEFVELGAITEELATQLQLEIARCPQPPVRWIRWTRSWSCCSRRRESRLRG